MQDIRRAVAAIATAVSMASVFAADAPKPAVQKVLRVPIASPAEGPLKQSTMKANVVGGKAARVVRLRGAADELLILLVMDVVGDLSLVDSARNTVVEQLKTMPATTWVGLLRAQDGLQVLLDPTPNRDKVASSLLAMPVTGKAALLDTAETALALADSIAAKSAVRIAVLYITDSDVRNYREDFTNPVINSSDSRDLSRRFPEGLIREKIARLTESVSIYQTPLFIVHLDYSSERLNEAYQSGLMQLASATGGTAVFARSHADVPDVVIRALSSIQGMYQAWVQLPAKPAKSVHLFLDAEGRTLDYRSKFILK